MVDGFKQLAVEFGKGGYEGTIEFIAVDGRHIELDFDPHGKVLRLYVYGVDDDGGS